MLFDGQESSKPSLLFLSSRQPQARVKIESTNLGRIDLSAHPWPWQQVAMAGCVEGLPVSPDVPRVGCCCGREGWDVLGESRGLEEHADTPREGEGGPALLIWIPTGCPLPAGSLIPAPGRRVALSLVRRRLGKNNFC